MSWPRILIATLSGLIAFALLVSGAAVLWVELTQRDAEGFYTSREVPITAGGRAIVVDDVHLDHLGVGWPQQVGGRALRDLVTVRVTARDADGGAVFVGIAAQDRAEGYLRGVAQDRVRDFELSSSRIDTLAEPGTVVPAPPGEQPFWVASQQGTGPQTLTWPAEEGRWSLIVMNPDGGPGVATVASAGASIGLLTPIAVAMLVVGGLFLLLAVGAAIVKGSPPGAGAVPVAPGPGSYPLVLEAVPDAQPSRWSWLVKWFLALPHLVVLALLWAGFAVLTVVAGVAILCIGRYPRALFDLNAGILRWTWRVAYYAYSALGTDRYPPFALAATDHPASLEIAYPQRLSRSLVLVKWLLVLPHLLIVAVLAGSAGNLGLTRWAPVPPLVGGGLIGLLVLVAAGHLALVGRYPPALHDLVVGLNRWLFRVIAYTALMTDEYPPFRLDLGGTETVPDGPARDDPGRVELQPSGARS
jgi:hypothetical protein